MNKERVVAMLDRIGLPYAYHHFAEGEAPELPYIIYYYPDTDNFGADNTVYHQALDLALELYSKIRDFDTEWNIEDELYLEDLFWQKSETYIESEKMYMIRYEMEGAVMG